MGNIYDSYGFRKLYWPNMQISVGDEKAFQNIEHSIRLCKKWCAGKTIKISYVFGSIPKDSIFENPGMELALPCEFMTKEEIDSLEVSHILLDTEEIKKQLKEQYNHVRNLVVEDMLQNDLERITLKKYNNAQNVLYTTTVRTRSKEDALVQKQYILFSKDTTAILDFLNTTTIKTLEKTQDSYISNKDFLVGTHQIEKYIPTLEKSKAKVKRITYIINDFRR